MPVSGTVEAVFHGADKGAAIKRAREIRGRVDSSWPPSGDNRSGHGYWSEERSEGCFLRLSERVVWPPKDASEFPVA